MGTLPPERRQQFREALLDAFPTHEHLEILVADLGKNLARIAMGDTLTTVAHRLIQEAEAGGWIARLEEAAYKAQPDNPKLKAFMATAPLPSKDGDTVDTPSHVEQLVEGMTRQKLLNTLLKLNEDDLATLVGMLGLVEYHHLGGDNSRRKTLELVLWAERHNHFPDLIRAAYDLYPNLGWSV